MKEGPSKLLPPLPPPPPPAMPSAVIVGEVTSRRGVGCGLAVPTLVPRGEAEFLVAVVEEEAEERVCKLTSRAVGVVARDFCVCACTREDLFG